MQIEAATPSTDEPAAGAPVEPKNVTTTPANEDKKPVVRKPPDFKGEVAIAMKIWKADIKTSHYTRERLTCCQKIKLKCCAPKDDDRNQKKKKKSKK